MPRCFGNVLYTAIGIPLIIKSNDAHIWYSSLIVSVYRRSNISLRTDERRQIMPPITSQEYSVFAESVLIQVNFLIWHKS